ncbi:MAG: family 78 glycoside hydrolase catalytic domain [Lachnospiraceae bacterium]|nr:family 78 glycoside hydrolase catalytic domain [Lachnospiraceae bacterium]
MKIVQLRVENMRNPIGVDVEAPVFSWRVETEERNWYQAGYRIRVWKTESGAWGFEEPVSAPVWDSGMVMSRTMNMVPYEGAALESDSRYLWKVDVLAENQEEAVSSSVDWFETAFYSKEDWKAKWITEAEDGTYHLMRKSFALDRKVKAAKLYACGLGQHECWINGQAVTDAVLEPGWTDYRKSAMYSCYDVTGLVKEGDNGISVKIGDGMYNVPGGRYVYWPRSFGKRKLLAQLRVTFEDGSSVRIGTDESWKQGSSPIQFCCVYGGEDYDGRIPVAVTSEADFAEDESWQPVSTAEAPEIVLRAAAIPPLRVMERYEPVSVKELEPGVFIYDLGKNFSGRIRIRIRTNGKMAGAKITMKPAELLADDGNINQQITRNGCEWNYLCNEQEVQEFAPDFTYTGFRYVRVEGAAAGELAEGSVHAAGSSAGTGSTLAAGGSAGTGSTFATGGSADNCAAVPILEQLTGEFIYPDMEETGHFTCSNELFNQIHALIRQAMLSNIKSYFTDCPQREKLPWMEETHLIGPAMLCNWDLSNLYEKIEQDMADSQRETGLVADICPEYVTGFEQWHEGFLDSPEWGSACVLNPWHLYCKYGNTRVLKKWYPTMKNYVDYLTSRTWHGVLHHGLGDWLDIGPCPPNSQNTPIPVTATTIYYIDLTVMKETAALLGLTEDAAYWEKQRQFVYEEYNMQFLDNQTGRYANGSQACQSMSLMAGLVPEDYQAKAIQQLKNDVVKRNYAITPGDVGHPYLVAALMEHGMSDLLNLMTNITETPGYGYQVVNGATTLTEDWDGPEPGKPHGSQNHLMLGSLDEWFYAGLGGIGSIRTHRRFQEITICPHIAEGIDFCSAETMHPYGKMAVNWKREGDHARVIAVIPPNTTAVLRSEDGSYCETVGSGTYEFFVPVK